MEQELWPGWKTVRLIGQGSFASVYEIQREYEGTLECSALKVISVSRDDERISFFTDIGYSTASITKQLEKCLRDMIQEYYLMWEMRGHSNIVSCEDMRYVRHQDGGGWDVYIRMELLQPLENTLESSYGEEKILKIGIDMCRALVECGKKNIIHRDIKPPNIFLSQKTGNYKLGDFGIAKVAENVIGDPVSGTYNYMAPEVYNHQLYDNRADIYSLGMVLFYLLNHRTMPFLPLSQNTYTEEQKSEAFHKRMSGEKLPPPMDGSPELKKITMKALEFLPEHRYRNPEEMLENLRSLLKERTVSRENDSELSKTSGKRKMPGKIAILSAAAILSVSFLMWIALQPATDEAAGEEKLRTSLNDGSLEFSEAEEGRQIRVLDVEKLRPGQKDTASAYYSIHTLHSVVFLDSAEAAPEWSWDVSRTGEGGVLAWTETSKTGKTILYVAANGGVVAPQNCSRLFEGFDALTYVELNNLDTSAVTDMSGMFASCVKLKEVQTGAMDTARVKNMSGMFFGCIQIETLDLSHFNTSSVTDMSSLFAGDISLREINLRGLDTSAVRDMSRMFLDCASLQELDLSGFHTGKAESMEGMFSICKGLKKLDLTSFDLDSVKDISMMFADCRNLEQISFAEAQFPPDISQSGVLKNCLAEILWQQKPSEKQEKGG